MDAPKTWQLTGGVWNKQRTGVHRDSKLTCLGNFKIGTSSQQEKEKDSVGRLGANLRHIQFELLLGFHGMASRDN